MIYEKRVGTTSELRRQLTSLDGDAGVRVVGRYGGADCFAFVTRFRDRFTLMVYSAEGRTRPTPGKLLESKELRSVSEVLEALEPISGRALEAYAY